MTTPWAVREAGVSHLESGHDLWNIRQSMVGFANSSLDVEIIAVDEGCVVHDANRGVVHYLDQTAAIALSLCDDASETVEKLESQGPFQ